MRTREHISSELALLASVVLHFLAFTAWNHRAIFAPVSQLLRRNATMLPSLPTPPVITFVEEPAPAPIPVPVPRKDPGTFVETTPDQVTGESPKNSTLYSDRATVAANPVNPAGKTGDTPFLDGKDTRMISTESVVPKPGAPAPPRPAPRPPSPPVTPPAPQPKPVEKPAPKLAETGAKVVKETTVAVLDQPVLPAPAPIPALPPKPAIPAVPESPVMASGGSVREIATVKSRLSASGTTRIGVAAFNVADSPFGPYDKALIKAVQSRWYALIDQNGLYERSGQVTLQFNLLADGSVQGLTVKENTAGQILGLFCEKAVVDSAPFPALGAELRTLIGNDPREINFTFYY